MTDGFRLVMTQGPQPGQTFTLDRDMATVGRDPASDITVNDPQVSRQHARLVRRAGAIVLEDLGSTNGTFVNGMRLMAPHTLANGDVIGLGDAVTLTFYGGAAVTEETMVGEPVAAPPYPPTARLPDAVAPPPAYAPPPDAAPKKSRTWLWIGCGCGGLVVLLAVLAAAVYVMDLYYPDVLYAPLQWLGF